MLASIRSSSGSNAVVSEGVEASVTYVRFKAAANEVFSFIMSRRAKIGLTFLKWERMVLFSAA